MDAVAEFLSRLPHEVARAGGSFPARVALLALALVLHVGFLLPRIPSGVPGAGVPGADKLVHLVVFGLTAWAAGRLLAPVRRFPMGWVVIALVVWTVLVEILQGALLPGRSADPADALLGVIGVGLGLGAWVAARVLAARRAPGEDPA